MSNFGFNEILPAGRLDEPPYKLTIGGVETLNTSPIILKDLTDLARVLLALNWADLQDVGTEVQTKLTRFGALKTQAPAAPQKISRILYEWADNHIEMLDD